MEVNDLNDPNKNNNQPQKAKPAKADGHRERMRERAKKDGLENFEDHRLLEMLLYYSIPRKDTREEAVALLERFGTIAKIFEADYRDLVNISGIGQSSAGLILVVKEIIRRSSLLNQNTHNVYKTLDSIIDMFRDLFVHETREFMYVASFDNGHHLISVEQAGDGSTSDISVSLRKINEIMVMNHAVSVAVAHNHPNGDLLPSNEDIDFTIKLQQFTADINVKLLEHIIFVDDASYPILRNLNME